MFDNDWDFSVFKFVLRGGMLYVFFDGDFLGGFLMFIGCFK